MSLNTVHHKPTFDRITQEKRTRILTVATVEFANNGFDNANINVIAKKADVSVGSLYKYFDTKTDLFLTCIQLGISTLENIIGSAVASEADVMVKLEQIIRSALDFSRKQQVLIKLYNEITSESNCDLVKTLSHDMESIAVNAYTEAIREGQRTGEIRKDIDPGLAAFLVDNLIMSIQFSYACDYYSERYKLYAGENILSRDDFAVDNFLKFIKSALKP